MPEPCKFRSLDRCQRSLLWTYKEINFAAYLVVGLVFQAEDAKNVFIHLVSKPGSLFFRVSKQGHGHKGGYR